MCKYLLCVLSCVLIFNGRTFGQILDEVSDDMPSFRMPAVLSGASQIALADESDEPDSGNWYEKLRWWKDAKALYTVDIKAAMDELAVLGEEFESKKNDILSALDRYSAELPLKRQAAAQVIDDLLADLVKRQEALAQERTRTQAKKDAEETAELEVHQKMLNELKKEFEDFNTLYQRLQQTFDGVVPSQMQSALNFSSGALAAYESIEHTLDDKKAHRLFNEVENGLENIQAISSYLKGPLWNFIDKAWASTEQLMPKISKAIADLEEKGVVVRPLTAQERTQMAQLEEERKAKRAQREAELKAAKEWQARPWWQKAYMSAGSFLSHIGSSIWYGITRPFSWISGMWSSAPVEKSVPVKAPKKVEQPAPSEPQPALPSKLPVVVSGSLAPQASPAPAPKEVHVAKPTMRASEAKEPVRILPRNEAPPKTTSFAPEPKKPQREPEEHVEETAQDEEDAEVEESEEEGDEADEEEVPDLESDEEESSEESEEETEPKPEAQNNQEGNKNHTPNGAKP